MIILEQCTVRLEPSSNHVPYGFSIGKYYGDTSVVVVICMHARLPHSHVACEVTSKSTEGKMLQFSTEACFNS